MSICLICKNNLTLHYGDDIYGENFCKECFDKYRCLQCSKLNIDILFDKDNNIVDILVKRFYGQQIIESSRLRSLFEPGYRFQLYCKECWDAQEMYQEDDNQSIEPEEDDDSYFSDEDYDEDCENNELYDSYYVGKGKYDLY
jgi:hypothetical protein